MRFAVEKACSTVRLKHGARREYCGMGAGALEGVSKIVVAKVVSRGGSVF